MRKDSMRKRVGNALTDLLSLRLSPRRLVCIYIYTLMDIIVQDILEAHLFRLFNAGRSVLFSV